MHIKPRAPPNLPVCVVLAAVTLAVFWPVRKCVFVDYDDQAYVTENPHVLAGLTGSGVAWAFRSFEHANWHPLTWLSHMADCQFHGLQPAGHHLTNLLLHTVNVLLLFLVWRSMTGAPWRSAWVAGLFALHPLRVESVAWVAERKDVLSGVFFMLTLWAYARHAKRSESGSLGPNSGPPRPESRWPSSLHYWLALLLFAFGLMSKPVLVTLPCVLLLLDYWPLRRFDFSLPGWLQSRLRLLLWEKAPFFLLSATSSVITVCAQKAGGAMVPTAALPMEARIETALIAYVRYLGKTFWPVDLAIFYPHPWSWPLWQVAGAVVVLAVFSTLAVMQARSRPYLLVGWLWFLGMLVPVIGLVQVGGQSLADRYTYLPLIGISVGLVWLGADLTAGARGRERALWAMGAALLLGCILATRGQLRHWENNERLFERALRVAPNNEVAHTVVAGIRSRQGRFGEAIDHFTEAIRLRPDYVYALNNLGLLLLNQGRTDEALIHLKRALEIDPDRARIHGNVGIALAEQGRLDEAARHLAQAIGLEPGLAEAYNELAAVYVRQGRFADAELQLRQALEHGADPAPAHHNLAMVCAFQGKTEASIAHYREVLHLQPEAVQSLNNLAWLLATHTDPQYRNGREAVALAERAVSLTQRREPGILDTLAAAYAEAERYNEAEQTSREAIALAKASGKETLAAQMESRRKAYADRKPWR